MKTVSAGVNPIEVKRGMLQASEAVTDFIAGFAKTIGGKDEIAQVASISAADTEIGETIAEAMEKVGKDGVITVEEVQTFGMELDFTDGMQFDKGFISPYFVTDADRQEAILENPYILIVNSKITAVNDLLPILEKVMNSGKPLLILAEDIEGEALATLVVKNSWYFYISCCQSTWFWRKKKSHVARHSNTYWWRSSIRRIRVEN